MSTTASLLTKCLLRGMKCYNRDVIVVAVVVVVVVVVVLVVVLCQSLSAGAAGAPPADSSGGPSLEGVDRKMLQCFPDLEKVTQPSAVVTKAGISIGKRTGRLDVLLTDLDECVETPNITKILC